MSQRVANIASHLSSAKGAPSNLRRLSVRWTRLLLDNAPCARSSHGLSAIGGRACLFGGEAKARHAIDSAVHRLEITGEGTGRWTMLLSDLSPTPRVGHAQCAVDGKLVVFGGRTDVNVGEGNLNDLWSFDPSTNQWIELLQDGVVPCPRSFHRAAAVGENSEKLYVFGGCGAEGRLSVSDLHECDMVKHMWSKLPSPPGVTGRGGATLEPSMDGMSLWLLGDFDGDEANDLLRFDLQAHEWHRMPSNWLRSRSVAASFHFDLGVWVFGGEVSPSDKGHEGAGGFAGDLLAIDALSGEPLQIILEDGSPTPPARGWGSSATTSPSEGVLFGGLAGDDHSPARLNDAWLLRVC
jgi:hypothetical protein